MWKKVVGIGLVFVLGYGMGKFVNKGGKVGSADFARGYPVSVEWLSPATDADPNPVRKTIKLTSALEGNARTEISSIDEELPAHSVVLEFDGGRRFAMVGHAVTKHK